LKNKKENSEAKWQNNVTDWKKQQKNMVGHENKTKQQNDMTKQCNKKKHQGAIIMWSHKAQ